MAINYYVPNQELEIAENIFKTKIEGLFYIKYKKMIDERGFFSQILEPERIRAAGINSNFQIKQVNLSVSQSKIVRGLHSESWNKLVTVIAGHAFCALADVRHDSPSYKNIEYFDFVADPQNEWGESLYISKKIGNSICAIEGPVYYLYGVDLLYHERDEKDDLAISIFDQDLNITWPFAKEEMIISQRDLDSITLRELHGEN
ncbi:MAG TPA: dTDP-4-dehydrorhamnose 3,5-epimerase family protein [Candidatus Woesebacteria bacterium]|nr:dTDP-4-dehydrorhamnose 3,5-epimerase family protein [Candidatus Woesebacteria bacterium]